METRTIGIAMSGVTGRMGTNQHLIRSILAIIKQGGVRVSPALTLMPDPVLVGRNADKLRALAEAHGPDAVGGPLKFTTDAEGAISDPSCEIVFDASTTQHRAGFVELAAKHGKHVYCEKPTATTTATVTVTRASPTPLQLTPLATSTVFMRRTCWFSPMVATLLVSASATVPPVG